MAIKHLHILLRAECSLAPGINDEQKIYHKVINLISDIGMNVFMDPKVKYMGDVGNEGLSFTAGLETSHMSYHSWEKPESSFLSIQNSTLHQMDCYTCGSLDKQQVKKIFEFLSEYEPKCLNSVIFNRGFNLVTPYKTFDWNINNSSWEDFLNNLEDF